MGTLLEGKYRLERVIGRGGMGVVVAATHTGLQQPVAIKFLKRAAAKRRNTMLRFFREAKLAARIASEHAVRVIDVGFGSDEGTTPYMVMEHLEGEDLSAVVERGTMDARSAVALILQACDALAVAHELGVVHRDLKPANLFLVRRSDGRNHLKVLDFGISKLTEQSPVTADGVLTKTATLMGTPLYMSPEQMTAAKSVDARSDIWALGVILYQMIAGRRPFEATSLGAACKAVLVDEPARLRDYAPGVDPVLEAIVLRCLAKKREARFASVGELVAALAPFAANTEQRGATGTSGLVDAPVTSQTAFQATQSATAMTDAAPQPRIDTVSQSPVIQGSEPQSPDTAAAATAPATAAAATAPATAAAATKAPATQSLALTPLAIARDEVLVPTANLAQSSRRGRLSVVSLAIGVVIAALVPLGAIGGWQLLDASPKPVPAGSLVEDADGSERTAARVAAGNDDREVTPVGSVEQAEPPVAESKKASPQRLEPPASPSPAVPSSTPPTVPQPRVVPTVPGWPVSPGRIGDDLFSRRGAGGA